MKSVTLLLVCLLSACSMIAPRQRIEAENPSSVFEVKVYEPVGQSLWIECGVYAEITKNASPYVNGVPLALQDNFDCRFDQTFKKVRWESDNTLRFINSVDTSETTDTVVVTNRTEYPLKLVRVASGDIFLTLDIDAHAKRIFASPHLSGTRWISAFAVTDKNLVLNGGADLKANADSGQRKICIYVENGKILVSNQNPDC